MIEPDNNSFNARTLHELRNDISKLDEKIDKNVNRTETIASDFKLLRSAVALGGILLLEGMGIIEERTNKRIDRMEEHINERMDSVGDDLASIKKHMGI